MTDYTPEPTWTFTSAIERPDGFRVEVTIEVPAKIATGDVRENAEIAGMAANHVFATAERSAARQGRGF